MKYVTSFFSTVFAVSAGLWLLPQTVGNAVTLRDGTIAFTEPPRLVSATTPYNDTNTWDTTYYFTLEVPATAGEPLQQVTFNQIQGIEQIQFNHQDTFAFEGTRDRQGTKLALNNVTIDQKQQTVTVKFDSPVTPGKTVTIGLRTFRNPTGEGVYLFGVTAFPVGQKTVGQYLGTGRLQFYSDTSSGN
ncbi:MAG: DUF2808 domain-containing protein [Gloeotrichia echinulata DVL01]|jgi:hypothetical protein|nr:DUF2808 domain-containing protein [Gloeotrichia echinulata DEX184]